jgi:lipopolysaccharide export system permease protein
MLPLSIYLTNRATKDRPLFELDGFLAPIKTILTKEATIAPLDPNIFLDKNSSEYEKIKGYSDKKLIDIVKNYRQYDLDESYRNSSIKILNARGITEEELRFGGNLRNENYENALRYKAAYVENSRLSFKLYFIYIIPLLAGLILNNNGFPILGKILIVFGAISATLFLITLAKSFISQVSFNKLLDRNTTSNVFILILVGIPLYFLYFNFYKKKMKEDLKQIR